MATGRRFLEHVLDLFSRVGPLTTGRMFSGTAIYVEGDVMFATILDDTVWMKSDDTTRADFEQAGSRPFSYDRSTGARQVTSLMSLPESALDDPDEAFRWAEMALPPAREAAAKKRARKARKPRKGSK